MTKRNETHFIDQIQKLFIMSVASKITLLVKALCKFKRNIEKKIYCDNG